MPSREYRLVYKRREPRGWNVASVKRVTRTSLAEGYDVVELARELSLIPVELNGVPLSLAHTIFWLESPANIDRSHIPPPPDKWTAVELITGRQRDIGVAPTVNLSSIPVIGDQVALLGQKVTDWVAPIGVALDTAKSVYARFHRYGELLAPESTAKLDSWLADTTAQAKAKVQPLRDKANAAIVQAGEAVDRASKAFSEAIPKSVDRSIYRAQNAVANFFADAFEPDSAPYKALKKFASEVPPADRGKDGTQ
jgi:hypothetical protein